MCRRSKDSREKVPVTGRQGLLEVSFSPTTMEGRKKTRRPVLGEGKNC